VWDPGSPAVVQLVEIVEVAEVLAPELCLHLIEAVEEQHHLQHLVLVLDLRRTLGVMLGKKQSPPAAEVPVSAYGGSSKNLKDLKHIVRYSTIQPCLRP